MSCSDAGCSNGQPERGQLRPMNKHQEQFLKDEFFSLTLMATVQRAHVYVPNANPDSKWKFQTALRSSLERVGVSYYGPVSEEDHIRNIATLSEELSADQADVLAGGCFRIGTAQKALNLHLKYLWCLGKIPAPPHCPFDSWVIARLPGYQGPSWTAINDLAQYRNLVAVAKAKAGGISLAEWELQTYNDAVS
jgi:hypothetical protein